MRIAMQPMPIGISLANPSANPSHSAAHMTVEKAINEAFSFGSVECQTFLIREIRKVSI